MTYEMKHVQKISYEEWEAIIFEKIKNRFYIADIVSFQDCIKIYFCIDFTISLSKLHFEHWYNKYLYSNNNYYFIKDAVIQLDDFITKSWMERIKK